MRLEEVERALYPKLTATVHHEYKELDGATTIVLHHTPDTEHRRCPQHRQAHVLGGRARQILRCCLGVYIGRYRPRRRDRGGGGGLGLWYILIGLSGGVTIIITQWWARFGLWWGKRKCFCGLKRLLCWWSNKTHRSPPPHIQFPSTFLPNSLRLWKVSSVELSNEL